MAAVVVDLHQDGPARRRRVLQGGGKLPRLPRRPPVVIPSADAKDGGVPHALPDVLDPVHLLKGPAFGGVLHGAKLRNAERAHRAELQAHCVGVPDPADGRRKEVGALRDRPAYQDSARAVANPPELPGARVALPDEILRAGYEVPPGVRLGGLEARLVPSLALLFPAPRVGIGNNHAPERDGLAHAETGRDAGAIVAIAPQ